MWRVWEQASTTGELPRVWRVATSMPASYSLRGCAHHHVRLLLLLLLLLCAGVTDASALLKHLIEPGRFVQLVAEQQGGPSASASPPPNSSLRQMLRWKHASSNAVAVVAKAVLQGKVPQLEAAIEQRRVRDAQIAEGEKKLSAIMEVFRQEMEGLKNPGSGQQSDGEGGLEHFNTDGLGNQLATTAAAVVDLSQQGAAEDEPGCSARYSSQEAACWVCCHNCCHTCSCWCWCSDGHRHTPWQKGRGGSRRYGLLVLGWCDGRGDVQHQ